MFWGCIVLSCFRRLCGLLVLWFELIVETRDFSSLLVIVLDFDIVFIVSVFFP